MVQQLALVEKENHPSSTPATIKFTVITKYRKTPPGGTDNGRKT
jgi:hypothetical protein